MRLLIYVAVAFALAGCRMANFGNEDLARYMEFCRETALLRGHEEPSESDESPDWMIGSSATTWEFRKGYRIVYADKEYVSFYAEEYSYMGGAHGSDKISVGTFCRKTGKRLTLDGVFGADNRLQLNAALKGLVVAKLGSEEALQGDVVATENFYLDKDGWHFVYNEYEVACYAMGAIEVAISKCPTPFDGLSVAE